MKTPEDRIAALEKRLAALERSQELASAHHQKRLTVLERQVRLMDDELRRLRSARVK